MKRIFSRIRKYFAAGLLTILPISISVYILFILFKLVDGILGRFAGAYLKTHYGIAIPGLGLILFILLILAAGIFATHFFGAGLHRLLDNIIGRFPILRYIYPALKKVFEFLFAENRMVFTKTVLLQYPSEGRWCIGFIANDAAREIEDKIGNNLLNIYVPSSPNPTTGYVVFMPKDKVIVLNIGVKEAMRLIISGGILNPADIVDTNNVKSHKV